MRNCAYSRITFSVSLQLLRRNYFQQTKSIDFSWNSHYEEAFKFYDKKLLDDTRSGVPEVSHCLPPAPLLFRISLLCLKVTEFWRLLALCHTVMPERDKGQLVYQAQSPDEAALTSAARNFGFVFRARTPQSITIEVMGKEEVGRFLSYVKRNQYLFGECFSLKRQLYCIHFAVNFDPFHSCSGRDRIF